MRFCFRKPRMHSHKISLSFVITMAKNKIFRITIFSAISPHVQKTEKTVVFPPSGGMVYEFSASLQLADIELESFSFCLTAILRESYNTYNSLQTETVPWIYPGAVSL